MLFLTPAALIERFPGEPQTADTLYSILAAIYVQAFKSSPEEVDEIREMIKDEMTVYGHHYIIAVSENTGDISGFVSWRVDFRPKHQLVELYHLCAIQQTETRLLGFRLMEQLIRDADTYFQERGKSGVRQIWLRTKVNAPAEDYYLRFGFVRCGVLPKHTDDSSDQVAYQLHVPRWHMLHEVPARSVGVTTGASSATAIAMGG